MAIPCYATLRAVKNIVKFAFKSRDVCTTHQATASGFRKIQVFNKKLSYCWETVRHESMPRIAEMDVEMTTSAE